LFLGKCFGLNTRRGEADPNQTAACLEPCEETVFSGIGAVLFNPRGERVRFFSQRLDTEILKKLNAQGAIYECEFFALFVRFAMFYFSR
jgi:hypothetical protein